MIEIPKIKVDGASFEINPEKAFKKSIVDLSKPAPPPPICISFGYHTYKGNNYPTPIGSYGDFSCIVGASKSKKTFLKSMLTAGFIGGNSGNFTPSTKGHYLSDSKRIVIDIDTEQSAFHAYRVFKRVTDMVGGIYDFYIPLALRKYTPEERLQVVDWLLTKWEKRNDIALVNIDGVADLVNDVNNLEEANTITQKLLTWTSQLNCHIMTVLHLNHNSDKPTGHLGSAVMKKAETLIFVEKTEDGVIVSSEKYSRNIPFDTFCFDVDKTTWLPYEKSLTSNNNETPPFI